MPTSKVHIPGFGVWNQEKDVEISDCFNAAMASRADMQDISHKKKSNGSHENKHGKQIHNSEENHRGRRNSGEVFKIPEKNSAHDPKIRRARHERTPSKDSKSLIIKTSHEKTPSKDLKSLPLNNYQVSQHTSSEGGDGDTQFVRRRRPNSISEKPMPAQKDTAGFRMPSPLHRKKNDKNSKVALKKTLPTFGEWDLDDSNNWPMITEIFDEARNERQRSLDGNGTPTHVIRTKSAEEDLYKPSHLEPKRRKDKLLSYLSNLCGGKVACH